MADVIEVKKDETLIQEGSYSRTMYYVKTGKLSVLKKIDGVNREISVIGAGELVGELSFLDKGPRSATVVALKDCQLVEIPENTYLESFDKMPIWYRVLINTLLDRLREANKKIRV